MDYTRGSEVEMLLLRLTFAALVLGSLDIWIGFELVRALRTGIANAAGTDVPRRKRPCAYWLTIAAQAGWVVALAAVLLAIVSKSLAKSVLI